MKRYAQWKSGHLNRQFIRKMFVGIFFFSFHLWLKINWNSFPYKSMVEGEVMGSRPTMSMQPTNEKKVYTCTPPPPLLGTSHGLPPFTSLCVCVIFNVISPFGKMMENVWVGKQENKKTKENPKFYHLRVLGITTQKYFYSKCSTQNICGVPF